MASVLVIPLCLLDYVWSGLLSSGRFYISQDFMRLLFPWCLPVSPGRKKLLSWGRVGCPLLYPQVHLAGHLSVLSCCVAFAR